MTEYLIWLWIVLLVMFCIRVWVGYLKHKQLNTSKITEEWNEDRIDIIGQNGNDGLHYDKEKK